MHHATVALHWKLKGSPFGRFDKFNVVCKSEEHFKRISGIKDYRLFIILHRNRVDSADAEKDFCESTVRISDCRTFSILKTVPVSQDSKELCLMQARRILSNTIRNLYLESLGISEQTLNTLAVSYTHLSCRRIERCRSRWSPYH